MILWQGKYINASRCDGTGRQPLNPSNAVDCPPCEGCPDMHVVNRTCSGQTYSDTHECKPCNTSVCGPNTFIAGDFCNGINFAVEGVILPENCRQCDACPNGSIAYSGCDGTDRISQPGCLECDRACEKGQYVSTPCSPVDASIKCSSCTKQSPPGTFFVAPCSGRSTQQDIQYQYCAACLEGQYINSSCPGS